MNFISSNIRYIRNTRNLTQEQFADDLNWSKSMVGSYEEGRSEPSIEKLIKCKCLTLTWILLKHN